MTVEDDTFTDVKQRMNNDLFDRELPSFDFAKQMSSLLLSKSGMFRGGIFELKPMTAARGIATLTWEGNPQEIFIPRIWASRMKLPYRETSKDGSLRSPYFSFMNIREGDYGVVLRCPVISVGSVQPVRIRLWDNPTIGCHPSMCPKMGLDFDGDEVHFAVVSGSDSKLEIQMAIEKEPSQKFSDSFVNEAVTEYFSGLEDNDGSDLVEDCINNDFMMASTSSITQLNFMSFDTKYHRLCKVKDEYRQIMFKGLALECSTIGNSTEPLWLDRSKAMLWSSPSIPRDIGSYGIPALRLITEMTNLVIQRTLDRAKHVTTDF
ncbi:hypothetical protein DFJ73DRAFT_631368 [Zopfochytrium polystomum]|nr:hypothetical protein DFJ73DRAFT_631368 [Zopfochytrium polystomum]